MENIEDCQIGYATALSLCSLNIVWSSVYVAYRMLSTFDMSAVNML